MYVLILTLRAGSYEGAAVHIEHVHGFHTHAQADHAGKAWLESVAIMGSASYVVVGL